MHHVRHPMLHNSSDSGAIAGGDVGGTVGAGFGVAAWFVVRCQRACTVLHILVAFFLVEKQCIG